MNPAQIAHSFQHLTNTFLKQGAPKYAERIAGLKRLKTNLLGNRQNLQLALQADLGKSAFESESSELVTTLLELEYILKNLQYWMQRRMVDTPWFMTNTSSYIQASPKGVVLIIAPWNYPILLCLVPLMSAYAAGNKIVVKPSEKSPHAASFIQELMEMTFSNDEVVTIQGDAAISAQLSQLPFHHIFFTGGYQIAKEIIKNSAKNITPLTLELGGKSPAILTSSVHIKEAVRNIAFGKCLNAGQTCIAPDFTCIPIELVMEFTIHWNYVIEEMYGKDPLSNPEYCKIINEEHFNRLLLLLEQAKNEGVKVIGNESVDKARLKMNPLALMNVNWDSSIMREEIFGPILPVIAYSNLNELVHSLQVFHRPLNLYIFGNKSHDIDFIVNHTRSGGVTINNCFLNYCNVHLPFGGEGYSGYGAYHGKEGFEVFSHNRSFTKQHGLFNSLKLFMPPYTKFKTIVKELLIKFTI